MINKSLLASQALTQSLRVRKRLNLPLDESVSALDAAEKLGVEVRLIDLPSMEGMYVSGSKPKIMLSSLRPQGRRNFTCAHEIGHHTFNHGEQFDELTKDKTGGRKNDPNEFLADCFAGYFLMPKTTIDSGMKQRGFSYGSLDHIQTYKMASWLGVGYQTLVKHLLYSLKVISSSHAVILLKKKPKDIRDEVIGERPASNLHIVDTNWRGRAVDCEVEDLIRVPFGFLIEGNQLQAAENLGQYILLRALTPGIARLTCKISGWSAFVRISPKKFFGRSCFRFEEEVTE